MTLAVLRTMLLSLVRDRGALALAFLLPVAFFLVFAAIFAGPGDAAKIDVAVADEGRTAETARFVRGLARESVVTLVDRNGRRVKDTIPALSGNEVRELVRGGRADVGLIVRREAGSGAALFGGEGAEAPITLVEDPARGIAAQIVLGLVQKVYTTVLPDIVAGGGVQILEEQVGQFTPEQQKRWDRALASLRKDALEPSGGPGSGGGLADTIEIETVAGTSAARNLIAYYAGAVAVMFLLLATAQTAVVLLEERDTGILDRVLAGPAGMVPLLRGKFVFLVGMGFCQVTLIFLTAWIIRGVALPAHWLGYTIVTLAASLAAAGIALALTSACRSRRQANSVATIGILIISAVGGSMVPRFFMPPLFRTLGWLTPNTWALEAYTRLFWRDEPLVSLTVPVTLLVATGIIGFLVARRLTRRWECL